MGEWELEARAGTGKGTLGARQARNGSAIGCPVTLARARCGYAVSNYVQQKGQDDQEVRTGRDFSRLRSRSLSPSTAEGKLPGRTGHWTCLPAIPNGLYGVLLLLGTASRSTLAVSIKPWSTHSMGTTQH